MKIIALLPVKNEEKMLPSYLSSVALAVDEIVAIDDNSTDSSVEILKNAGAHVYNNDVKVKSGWAELGIREKLLKLGREHGGTHFVCLDADETFTGQFPSKCREICKKLQPGQKLQMQWLAMWKSVDHYRDDNSVWSNNYKDFIFCDDGKIKYPNVWMHTPRTPGRLSNENDDLRLNSKYGAVLHFQFSDWNFFQIKQSWLRMSELLKGDVNSAAINQKYKITLDDQNVILSSIPENWKTGIVFPEITYSKIEPNWRLKQISNWFTKHGTEYFKDLEIWHVQSITNLVNDKYKKENYVHVEEHWKKYMPKVLLDNYRSYFKGDIGDFGCNTGLFDLHIAEISEVNSVIGIDINQKAVERANSFALQSPSSSKVKFMHKNLAEKLDLENCFDFIICFHVLEHVFPEDVDAVVKNISKCIKSNGHVLVNQPDKHSYPWESAHVFHPNKEDLSALFEKYGFVTLEAYEDDRGGQTGRSRNITALFKKC